MARAATLDRGGPAIETWLEPCPHCGHELVVPEHAATLTCGGCREAFHWPGRAASPDRPTRIVAAEGRPHDPADGLVGRRLGRWTLSRLLGRGGMGRVYEARGGLMNRRVALKVLGEDLAADTSFVKRFHREARLLATLSHPHIVNVIERGEDDGRLWFAMDYVRGESLRRRMERGPLAAREACRIASEIASALAYAHGRGVVHRDLKPENVLLDASGSVHLVDFGLSRLVDADAAQASTRLTRTDVILGTYEYMAPEQRRGERHVDARADVFALGVILYELLTGGLPLGRFSPPSESAADVPVALDEVVNRALAPEPAKRFASAADMQQAVARALDAAPERPVPATGTARAPGPSVPSHEIEEARGILRHAEIVGAIDRVLGLVLVLAAFFAAAGTLVIEMIPYRWAGGFAGILSFMLGLWLLGLGRRVARLEKGARESQVTLGVVLLFFPPFLTAYGIYALIVMTSDRARNAFALGRKALVRPDVLVSEPRRGMPLRAPERPRPASLPMRLFALLALFMGVYVALLGLDVLGEEFLPHDALARAETVFAWAVAASIFSLLVLIRMFLVRRQRRGFGLALLAFLALWGSTSFLSTAIQVARDPTVPGPGAVHRPWSWSQVRRNHPFPWGRSPGRADPWGIFRQGSR